MFMKIFKKLAFAFFLLYSFDLIAVKFGVLLPINYATLFLVSLLDVPGLILLLFSCFEKLAVV